MRLVREGLHSGAWQWAFVNVVPRLARASICGVLASGCPLRCPIQSFWSSMAIKRMFGWSAAYTDEQKADEQKAVRKQHAIIVFIES
jgi:hypothetical protein